MAKKKTGQHTSHILAEIIEQIDGKESISVKDMIKILGERVFGISILIFCIPNILPIPNVAGLSALTGIPIGLMGLQMIIGWDHPWLPHSINKKKFSGKKVCSFLKRAIPKIKKIEFLLHPRLHVLTSDAFQRVLGVAFVILATIMSLPIPFGNFMPGLSMILIAIGLLERDGLLVLFGLLMGIATFVLMLTVGDAVVDFVAGIWD